MAEADDSAVLNTSRDSDSESRTDDERLERRMWRAVLDPAYLDGNFSDDESRRVLRSSTRSEEVVNEPAAMETRSSRPCRRPTAPDVKGEPLHRQQRTPLRSPLTLKQLLKIL